MVPDLNPILSKLPESRARGQFNGSGFTPSVIAEQSNVTIQGECRLQAHVDLVAITLQD